MRYVRKPDVITAASKVTTRSRSYRFARVSSVAGNSGVALDGAGVRPAKGDHMDSQQCKVTTD